MGVKRVLVIDDSPAMCRFLEDVLQADPLLEVVGHALDPYDARDKIKRLNPDVLTLDIEMPRMDGMTFLRNLMRLHPLPVVMVSSLTAAGVGLSLEALEIGAFDVVVKRHPGKGSELDAYLGEIRDKVRAASQSDGNANTNRRSNIKLPGKLLEWQQQVAQARPLQRDIHRLVVIGSSTGGPQALREVLSSCTATGNAMVIAQHIPGRFTAQLARRLNSQSHFVVRPAEHGAKLEAGVAYLAPGDEHLQLIRADGRLYCHVDRNCVAPYTPSVDRLMESTSRTAGASAVGLLLTGMGTDGASGLASLQRAGALTLVQDEASSAVWGMPGAAVATGAAHGELPLQAIGDALNRVLSA